MSEVPLCCARAGARAFRLRVGSLGIQVGGLGIRVQGFRGFGFGVQRVFGFGVWSVPSRVLGECGVAETTCGAGRAIAVARTEVARLALDQRACSSTCPVTRVAQAKAVSTDRLASASA